MSNIQHIPNLNEKHPVIHPPILPCTCNSEFSTICVSNDEGWHWVTCLGCFRESSTRAATTEYAIALWNSEIEAETQWLETIDYTYAVNLLNDALKAETRRKLK